LPSEDIVKELQLTSIQAMTPTYLVREIVPELRTRGRVMRTRAVTTGSRHLLILRQAASPTLEATRHRALTDVTASRRTTGLS